jgi:hypothetical protein
MVHASLLMETTCRNTRFQADCKLHFHILFRRRAASSSPCQPREGAERPSGGSAGARARRRYQTKAAHQGLDAAPTSSREPKDVLQNDFGRFGLFSPPGVQTFFRPVSRSRSALPANALDSGGFSGPPVHAGCAIFHLLFAVFAPTACGLQPCPPATASTFPPDY